MAVAVSLKDHALERFANVESFSQFGEGAMVAAIFDIIGERSRVAVEFGAGDGSSCSNTAHLWRNLDWRAVLVEPDRDRFEDLEGNAGPFDTICRHGFVTPDGPTSIASILDQEQIDAVDFMSIDVDGDDWLILAALTCRPRVISIEFNPTVPPHIDARQPEPGGTFGASLLAIIRVGESIGYRFVGATHCNAFLIDASEAQPFNRYVTDPAVLFPAGNYNYAATDFHGRVVILGPGLPWEAKDPYVLPIDASAYVLPPTNNPHQLRRGFESIWGPAQLISPNGLSPERLVQLLDEKPPLLCVDLSTADLEAWAWVADEAARRGYRPLFAGRVLGLIRQETDA